MTQRRWDIPDFETEDQTVSGRQSPTLVSLHFITSALRRRRLVIVLSPIIGLLVAAALLVVSPPPHDAKASLVLTHDPQVDPTRAMATDVSLLRIRAVADQTVASLGLTMSPEDFLKSVRAEPVSSELLTLTLAGPTDAEAVRRLNVFTAIYLNFRGEQLSMQSNVYVDGIQQRITKLEAEVSSLSRRIEELSAAGSSSASKLSDTIAQRAYLQGRIETLQQSVEDATLQTTAVVSSSRVIDPPAPEGGAKRQIVLVLASGLIGGAALGCGIVLFFAITSDRLRRRADIASALEVPVPVSVGRITPVSKRWLWLPPLRALETRRSDQRQRLAHTIEMELPVPGHGGRLAVACIDNADEVRFAFAAAVSDLAAHGRSVAVIDLTDHGVLTEMASSIAGPTGRTTLLRPDGIPSLASGPIELRIVGDKDGSPPALEQCDVTLVLADLDPSVGAEFLTAWTDRVFAIVTAGRSSAEGVRTSAELVRAVGLDLRLAAVLRTERTDESFSAGSGLVAVQLQDAQDQPVLDFEEPAEDEERLAAGATSDSAPDAWLDDDWADETDAASSDGQQEVVAAMAVLGAEPFPETDESHAADEEAAAAEHLEDRYEDAQELVAIEEQEEALEEHDDTQQLVAIEEELEEAPEGHDDTQQLVAIEEELEEAPEEQPIAEAQPVAIEEQEEAPEEHDDTQQLVASEDKREAPEEQPIADEELAATEQDEEAPEEHDDTQQLVASGEQEEDSEEQPIAEEQLAATEQDEEAPEEHDDTQQLVASGEQEEDSEEQPIAEEQLAATEQQYEAHEEHPFTAGHALQVADLTRQSENDQAVEPDHVPEPWAYEANIDGWNLYIVKDPPAAGEYFPGSEDDGFDWSWDWEVDDVDFKTDSTVVDTADEPEDESTTQEDAEEDAQSGSDDQVDDRSRAFARVRTRTRSRSRRRSNRHK
jgi:capsular polysaccharide biosynthesis protein